MPKTEVILTHNVIGLGAESDHVKVAAGYARNYLFPQGLAIPLTAANKRRLDALRQRRSDRETHELSSMTELAQSLSKMILTIQVKAGEDGRMFGSVTAGTIADELKHQFEASVEKRKIHLPHPIKKLGDYDVELRLHQDVVTSLKVRVASSTPVQPTEAAAPKGAADHARQPAPQGKQAATPAKSAPASASAKPAAKTEAKKERPPRKTRPGDSAPEKN